MVNLPKETTVDHTLLCQRIIAEKGDVRAEKVVLPGFTDFHTKDEEFMETVYGNLLKGRSHFESFTYVYEDEDGEKQELFSWQVGGTKSGTFANLHKQPIGRIAEVLAAETTRFAKRAKISQSLYIELENRRFG